MSEKRPTSSITSDVPSQHIGILACDLSHRHGWAHYSLSLIEALARAGARLTIITAKNSPDVDGLTLHKLLPNTLPAEKLTLFRQGLVLPQVRAILAECDIIHATIEPYAPLAAWVAGGRPYVVTGHGSYVQMADERVWPVSAIYRRALRNSRLVCVSRYTARVAKAALPGVQPVVVNNGVDVERFISTPKHVVGEGLKPSPTNDVKTVLAVGAVKPRKGTLELVRAMAEVRAKMSEAGCIIIGSLETDRAYVERVRAEIEWLGLSETVHLLGHAPEDVVLGWYARADVFAVPAMNDNEKFEGYGLVYLEASAAGLPVIGTTDNGAEDAIDDGVTGLLIPQNQVAEQLPGAILRILGDPALAERMGAAGKVKAAGQTWDHVARRMLALYDESEVSPS